MLREELKAARAEYDRFARVATQDHAAKKAVGKRSGGNIDYLTSIRGSNAGYLRAGDRDRQMFELFGNHPEWMGLTHHALADHLNTMGIQNVVTIAGRKKSWTIDSLKKLRNRYRKHFEVEVEMDISDGITPLDLHGVHRRVTAAKAKSMTDTSGNGS